MERDMEKGLSTGERKMLHSAKQIFLSEIVMALSTTYEAVEERINLAISG
jgi:CarD family transcriptional regulator